MKKINSNLVKAFISKRYICPIPLCMKLKNLNYAVFALAALSMAGCGVLGKKEKGSSLPNDGQLHGIAPGSRYTLPKPPGMVYIPQGTFHMGPSDEDPAYAFSARNRSISISGFWMDATEITNNEYRQFVYWVRDSVAAKKMGFVKSGADGIEYVDQQKMKTLKWDDPKVMEQLVYRPDPFSGAGPHFRQKRN
jgi:sulfatase modifying factor 1